MGFYTGFTGGVTLTLGLAYVTLLAHQRNRRTQSALIRAQTESLDTFLYSATHATSGTYVRVILPKTRSFIETFKSRWNEEVENTLLWVQMKDWNRVGDKLESTVSQVLGGSSRQTGDESLGNPLVSSEMSSDDSLERKNVRDDSTDTHVEEKKMTDEKTLLKSYQSTANQSDVELALQKRYLTTDALNKSVEETLEKRYHPINKNN